MCCRDDEINESEQDRKNRDLRHPRTGSFGDFLHSTILRSLPSFLCLSTTHSTRGELMAGQLMGAVIKTVFSRTFIIDLSHCHD